MEQFYCWSIFPSEHHTRGSFSVMFAGQLHLRETATSHKLRDKAAVLPDQYSPGPEDARRELLPDQ